jgi:F0F1-type ATP synthase assembly protein I
VAQNEKSPWRHAQIGLQLSICVLAGFFAGYWADKKFATSPWLALTGAAIGMAAAFYSIAREMMDDK